MPNQNNNNENRPGGPKRRNSIAMLSVVVWALIITLFINYATSLHRQANTTEVTYSTFKQLVQEGKVSRVVMSSDKYVIYPKLDVKADGSYTYAAPGKDPEGKLVDPLDMLEEAQDAYNDLVAQTLPPISDEAGRNQLQADLAKAQSLLSEMSALQSESHTYYCAPVTQAGIPDDSLLELMEEHNVSFGPKYVEPLSPIVSFLLSIVFPTVLMVGLFYLLMRSMSSRMGGGGLGGVGKANAKV